MLNSLLCFYAKHDLLARMSSSLSTSDCCDCERLKVAEYFGEEVYESARCDSC